MEFIPSDFSQVLSKSRNFESMEIVGVFYTNSRHLFTTELPVLENLSTLCIKDSEQEILQHFKNCAVLTRLLFKLPKKTREYDMNPENYDESYELLKSSLNLKILTIINPFLIFKRDISTNISFRLIKFLISTEDDCSAIVLYNLKRFLSVQKKLQSLVMDKILTIPLLKTISEAMSLLKLELYGPFDLLSTSTESLDRSQPNNTVLHLVVGCKNQNANFRIDRVLALFKNTQILELKLMILSKNAMTEITHMNKLQKIRFSGCLFTHICELPIFLNDIVLDSIAKQSMLKFLELNLNIEKLTIFRKEYSFYLRGVTK